MKASLEDKIRDAMAFRDRLSLSPSQLPRNGGRLLPNESSKLSGSIQESAEAIPRPDTSACGGGKKMVKIDPNVQMSAERMYNTAKLQQKKIEAMRLEKEKELTFTPELVSSRNKREATVSDGQRFETLYQDSVHRRQKIEQEREKSKLNKECTFTPRTTALPKSLKKKLAKRPPSPLRAGDRLFANAKEIEEKKKALREQLEQSENLTFKPEITEKAKRAASGDALARAHSLHAAHKDRDKKIEQKRGEIELKGCTFKPKINRQQAAGTASSPKPATVQDRLIQYASKVEQKREQRRKELEAEEKQECTFAPKIAALAPPSEGSASCADSEVQPPSGEIHDRLYREAQVREHRKAQLAQQHDQSRGITFEPNAGKEAKRKVDPSVFERLSLASKKTAQEQELLKAKEEQELKNCTFAPNINRKNRLKRRESKEKVWNRLHKEREGVELERTRTRRMSEVKDCTFAPKVNRPRRDSASTTPSQNDQGFWNRLSTDNGRAQKIDKLKRSIEERERASCTFQPKLFARPPSPRPSEREKQGIFERLSCTKSLDQKKKEREKERQARELEECTFAPKIGKVSHALGALKTSSVDSQEERQEVDLETKVEPRSNDAKTGFLQRLEDQAGKQARLQQESKAKGQKAADNTEIPT